MAEYNLKCPKGYGNVTFLKSDNNNYCPISGQKICVECDVISFANTKDGQVKKREGSEEEESREITWL